MKHRTLCRLALCVLATVLAVVCPGAQRGAQSDLALSERQMALPRGAMPIGEYQIRSVAPGGSLRFPSSGDPIVDFRVVPPLITNPPGVPPQRHYEARVDYEALLQGGSILATFRREGGYALRLRRASGQNEYVMAQVGSDAYGTCFTGPQMQFPCPTADFYYVGQDVAGFPDGFPPAMRRVVMNLNDLIMKVCADFMAAGRPINIVIADHGCRGSFTINGVDTIAAGNANFTTFCNSLMNKVCKLTLIACSAAAPNPGQPDDGHDFICGLATCLMARVEGWETDIQVTPTMWTSANPVPFDKDLKGVPALPTWSLASLVCLGLAAGALLMRR
jgi:hypothetical protein